MAPDLSDLVRCRDDRDQLIAASGDVVDELYPLEGRQPFHNWARLALCHSLQLFARTHDRLEWGDVVDQFLTAREELLDFSNFTRGLRDLDRRTEFLEDLVERLGDRVHASTLPN